MTNEKDSTINCGFYADRAPRELCLLLNILVHKTKIFINAFNNIILFFQDSSCFFCA